MLRFYTYRLLVSILVLSTASIAIAQDLPKPDSSAMMSNAAKKSFGMLCQELDKDQDKKLSKIEFTAMYKDASTGELKYSMWDLDKDGYITEEEYVTAAKAIGNKKR